MKKISGERIQKVLASHGFGSRRQIEAWIKASRVELNGKLATLGCHIQPHDKIKLDGKLLNLKKNFIPSIPGAKITLTKTTKSTSLSAIENTIVLMYHKPVGELCTRRDPEGRPTVFDKLPHLNHERWVVVGRLDLNTSGLLLFTNNGELANHLMHPKNQLERIYAVRILGKVTDNILSKLKQGVKLTDGFAKFEKIKDAGGDGANHWYHVTLREGKNREVKRLWESQGLKVSRLIRIQFGSIPLPRELRAGHYKPLPASTIKKLITNI